MIGILLQKAGLEMPPWSPEDWWGSHTGVKHVKEGFRHKEEHSQRTGKEPALFEEVKTAS